MQGQNTRLFAVTGLKEREKSGNPLFIHPEIGFFMASFIYMDYGFAVNKHQEEQLLQVAYSY